MTRSDTYTVGPAGGLSRDLYAPDGEPWCRFGRGIIRCLNHEEGRCRNPIHAAPIVVALLCKARW
jgi:hypothetical protein